MAPFEMLRATAAGIAMVILLAGCGDNPAPAARVAPGASPQPITPQPSPTALRPPVAYLLSARQIGLPEITHRDHLGYLQAASEERNQAAALELYETFDWVDEAVRTFGTASREAAERLLVTLTPAGARNAYAYWAELAGGAPLVATPCPPDTGLDQCAEGRSGTRTAAAGRRGVVAFYITATGVDIDALLRAQAALLSAGPPA